MQRCIRSDLYSLFIKQLFRVWPGGSVRHRRTLGRQFPRESVLYSFAPSLHAIVPIKIARRAGGRGSMRGHAARRPVGGVPAPGRSDPCSRPNPPPRMTAAAECGGGGGIACASIKQVIVYRGVRRDHVRFLFR